MVIESFLTNALKNEGKFRMQLHYLVEIKNVNEPFLDVELTAERSENQQNLTFFLPSWSPGSYLMREYSKHLHWVKAEASNGEPLYFDQLSKNRWCIDWEKSDLKNSTDTKFSIKARFYCHELTVRTSYIDHSMAFLHGPTFLFGIDGEEMKGPTMELRFPADWSKVSTALKDISEKREVFLYEAEDYDHLLDSPILLGCHETDGFMAKGKPHELAFTGEMFPHEQNLKKDIETIVNTVSDLFEDELPYDKYSFLSILKPNLYGGLEHHDSTALVFDARKFQERKSYLRWLELVAHEYFHTWNVKRIRPKALGPFDYQNENYTSMLWLAEGLTSFMDQYFVYSTGLCTMEEYLQAQVENLNSYLKIPGRKFHSLEQSSFNAWIKLYLPDEFSNNSTVSYYLKGGIVFFLLHAEYCKQGKHLNEFTKALWARYKENPEVGMTSEEVYGVIENQIGKDSRHRFETWVQTTEELPIEDSLTSLGLQIEWEYPDTLYSGMVLDNSKESLKISKVQLDTPAYRAGFLPGDELIAINDMRIDSASQPTFWNQLIKDRLYTILIARQGMMMTKEMSFESTPRVIKSIKVLDEKLANAAFLKS